MFAPFARLGLAVALAAMLTFSWSKLTFADEAARRWQANCLLRRKGSSWLPCFHGKILLRRDDADPYARS